MDESLLHRLKVLAHSIVPVPSDALLVVAGLACYLGTCLIARQSLHWAWALVPGLCLSLALEAWEMWDYHGAQAFQDSDSRQHAFHQLWVSISGDILFVQADSETSDSLVDSI